MGRSIDRGSFALRRCVVAEVEAVEATSSLSFARHTHDSYGIGLITGGAQRSWSGRGTVEAVRGDLITSSPGEVHDGMPIGESRTWRMLYIAPTTVGAIVSDIRDGRSSDFEFADPVLTSPAPVEAFAAAYDALTGDHADSEQSRERLIILLAGLLREKRTSPPRTAPELARAKARIDADPAAPHSLEELGRQAGLSRYQALRGFARLTGLTPHSYVIQQRVAAARAMIGAGQPIADAAAACGFADQSHLTRAFVRRFGLSPGTYAAALR